MKNIQSSFADLMTARLGEPERFFFFKAASMSALGTTSVAPNVWCSAEVLTFTHDGESLPLQYPAAPLLSSAYSSKMGSVGCGIGPLPKADPDAASIIFDDLDIRPSDSGDGVAKLCSDSRFKLSVSVSPVEADASVERSCSSVGVISVDVSACTGIDIAESAMPVIKVIEASV